MFIGKDTGYTVGWGGKIYKTTDCGISWKPAEQWNIQRPDFGFFSEK